jgi:tetratricopeptide (TPR) repeat protein
LQTNNGKLESIADVNEANLLAQSQRVDDALRLYQRALALDNSNDDKSAGAVDWFAYGKFLDQAGFSERLAYACMVHSESLAQSLPKSPLPESVGQTQQAIEKKLGAAALAVRHDPNPALQEALALRR